MTIRRIRFPVVAVVLAMTSCGSPRNAEPPLKVFDVELRARDDEGAPLPGAAWSTRGESLGTTGPDGVLRLTLRGREGQQMPTLLNCPTGYVSPEAPAGFRVSNARAKPMAVEATCVRQQRDVVLVVRAENGGSLPVLVNGETVSITDHDGDAHVLLRVDRSVRKLDVTVDTSTRADLVPKDPARAFELGDHDAVLMLTESFVVKHPIRPRSQSNRKLVASCFSQGS